MSNSLLTKIYKKNNNFHIIKHISSKIDTAPKNKYFKMGGLFFCSLVLFVIFSVTVCIVIDFPTSKAINYIKKENYLKTVKLTTTWSKVWPRNPKWYSLRAYANYKLKNYDNAINDYDKAYKLENDEYKMMNFDNKIYIRYITKDYQSALNDFDTEIENTADSYTKDSLLWDKAQFLYNIKNYKESLKIYNQLLLNSENDQIYLLQNRLYYERSQVLHALGFEKEALLDVISAKNLNLEEIFQNKIPEPRLIMENFEEYSNVNLSE